MGRRRRRVIKVVKKKLPTVFSCPSCGEEAVRVVMNRNKNCATVQCAACGIRQEVETSRSDQMVDVYCRFTDRFYGVKEASAPKQTQAISEDQGKSETQEETPEATTETGETPDEVSQQSQEQTTGTTAQKTEETMEEVFQVEE